MRRVVLLLIGLWLLHSGSPFAGFWVVWCAFTLKP